MSRRKNAALLIIPVVSGYGPRVSVGVTTHVEAEVVGVVVVVVVEEVVVVLAAVGDDPHAAIAAAPKLAPSVARSVRRSRCLVSLIAIWRRLSNRYASS